MLFDEPTSALDPELEVIPAPRDERTKAFLATVL
jgi:ABC-type arginine transport system ATPase subunit